MRVGERQGVLLPEFSVGGEQEVVMMKSQPLAGVYPILATTFDDDGRLDLNSQESLVDYLLEQGANGFGLFGNASEGYALLEREREELLRLILRRGNGRVPLVVSTGHNGTYAAVELSRAAEAEGASALMVLPPYYMKTDAEGLMRYYSAIGGAVKIPIMVQDAPLATQVAMPPALLVRLSQEIENLQYVKVEAPPRGKDRDHPGAQRRQDDPVRRTERPVFV